MVRIKFFSGLGVHGNVSNEMAFREAMDVTHFLSGECEKFDTDAPRRLRSAGNDWNSLPEQYGSDCCLVGC
jgi:hypothetical protein